MLVHPLSFVPAVLAFTCLASPGDGAAGALNNEALNLNIRFKGKPTTAAKVEKELHPVVRGALNDWASDAARLQLEVLVPKDAPVLLIGRAPVEALAEAARCVERTAELFEALVPGESAGEGAPQRAIVIALFDEAGFASEAWPGLLDVFVERRVMTADMAARRKGDPGSITLRQASIFVQHTYDMVGDAEAGDDEFRVGNEIAHKTAQYLLEARFGRQPDVIRWGLGYVAEQRLFGNVYQFNREGFVAADDHFGWPATTRERLAERSRDKSFSLPRLVMGTDEPGSPALGQRCAWAVLDYQLHKQPERLAALLGQLGALHREGDPKGTSPAYKGENERSLEACGAEWSRIKLPDLLAHLKKLKK